MTREPASTSPATPSPARAPLKLSREMKLVLALLLLAALLGAWFVWTGNRSADSLAQVPPSTPAGDPPTEGTPAEGSAGGVPTPDGTDQTGVDQAAADGVAVTVQPSGELEVPTIPAFGAESRDVADPAAEALPVPGGINPDTALAALPGVNPFRPLALADAGESAQTPAAPVAGTPVSAAPADLDLPPLTAGLPTGSSLPGSGGALALSPLPGTAPEPLDTSAPVSGAVGTEALNTGPNTGPQPTPPVTGAAFPLPTLPGANVPAPTALTVTRAAPSPAGQPPVVRVLPNPAPSGQAAPRPAAARPPARPPVAGVNVPSAGIDLNAVLARQAARPALSPATGSAPGLAATGASALTALPTPGTPQPITQLGQAGEGGAPAPTNALEALVQSRELGLNAAVLGPVNTAILRSRDGFLVVSVGQTLPDSQVLVQGVGADRVTLALGPDTTTLHLDPTDPAHDPAKGEP